MKQILKMTLLIVLISIGISSCKTEEPETYWYGYGTYYESETAAKGFIIALDNNDILIPIEASGIHSSVEDSSRVVVTFSIVSEGTDTTQANVVEVTEILTKGILQLTENNEDSIGNDGIQLSDDNTWITENHLNFIFGYYGGSVSHYINLVKPIGEQLDENGRQILEFRHNDKNDPGNNWFLSVVSFDMRSLYQDGMDSINFVVRAKDFSNGIYDWEGTFHFSNNQIAKAPNKTINPLNALVE